MHAVLSHRFFTSIAFAASVGATVGLGLMPQTSHAQMMRATLTGTVIAGGDAYLNTVYFGPVVGGNLVGQTATIEIIYNADWFRPNYPGYSPNWTFTDAPPWYVSIMRGSIGHSGLCF